MRSLLPLLREPSRYTGIEQNAVHKDPAAVSLRCALCFPDLYSVGMSHLGSKIIYGAVNANPAWWAERCFEPDAEACALLRRTGTPLATLESDTPLGDMDLVGFSITHELCYTDVLNMLDLAGIPLRTEERSEDLAACPLVISGGGASISAEPMAPFLDAMVLGDAEESLPELCRALEAAKGRGLGRSALLRELASIPGIYVPSLFQEEPDGSVSPRFPDLPRPSRRIVADFDKAFYPARQVVPIATVHNRLSLEIARGCTRFCRFCHAGVVYRPARERSVETVERILKDCLDETGFDEISFLSLSAGDYSALKTLCSRTLDRCAEEQISLSLPSLRVGSIDDSIMDRMSRLRRTGVTLAPEAGSQRLRNVINKGITEEQLLLHVQKLLEYGWRQVKLYFMIGLPTETDEDLAAIFDLCRKVREAGGRGAPKLAVTAALSPFVPKPFTPFQWVDQIPLDEIARRVELVHSLFRRQKGLVMRWHEPKVSHLEGVLSRAGRRMAGVVERAFRKGAVFQGWMEHFTLEPWQEALKEEGFDEQACIRGFAMGSPLPWSHIESGVAEDFLRREWERALEEKVTEDCRYHACRQCGACDRKGQASRLPRLGAEENRNRLVFPQRDQEPNQPRRDERGRIVLREISARPPQIEASLTARAATWRIWHEKLQESCWLSQLELQAVLDRALRRARVPMAFSQGFHPMPLLSFGRALPVGVESRCEWFSVTLRQTMPAQALLDGLNACLPRGMRAYRAERAAWADKALQAGAERFAVSLDGRSGEGIQCFLDFWQQKEFLFTRETKKGPRTADVRALVASLRAPGTGCDVEFTCDWSAGYLSPLLICKAVLAPLGPFEDLAMLLHIRKTAQFMPGGACEEGC
ncbi:MAG: TIGR03960 family B12-binding radical SAM protein [Desulfovibrio sp.]|nr:TIGR03960 family B12-binding radical SAM protein [Desulfovibrio sp.]